MMGYNHKINGIDCISCMEPMKGIYSYEVRKICTPCGGHSLIAEQRQKQRERIGLEPVPVPEGHDGWAA